MRKHDPRRYLPFMTITFPMTTTLLCLGVFISIIFSSLPAAFAGPIGKELILKRSTAGNDISGSSSANEDIYAKTDIGTVISTNDIINPTKIIVTKNKAVKMSVTAGTKGFSHPQRWMMVECVMENSGSPVNGYIEVIPGSISPEQGMTQPTVYRKKLDLPRGARKKVEFNVLADSPLVTVRYVEGNKILLRTSAHTRWIDLSKDIIGVLTREDSSLNLFKDVTAANRGSEYVIFNDRSELPASDLGLSTLDILVLNGVSTQQLSKLQKTAILDWVRDGGTLVLGGGSDAAKTIAGLPKELVPVTLGASITSPRLPPALNPAALNPAALNQATSNPAALNQVAPEVAPIVMLQVAPKPADLYIEQGLYSYIKAGGYQGEVILGDKQTPLATQKALGKGYVIWVAFDLGSRPFSEWRANEEFWNKIMSHRVAQNDYIRTDSIYGTLSGLLYNVSSLKAPSLTYVILFLFLYLILVSPLNYLVLKKFDKREWAWITIPVFIALFGSASYWYAYVTKGGDVIVNQVGVLDVSPNEQNAHLYNVFGIYSPGKTSYTIKLPGGMSGSPTPESIDPGAMGGFDPAIMDLSGRPQIRDFNVAAWTMRSFIATGRIDFENKPASNLRYTKTGVEGSIKNNLPYSLADLFLIDGRRIYKIGTIQPGKTKKVAVKFSKTIPANESISERLFNPKKKGRAGPMGNPNNYSQKTMSKIEMLDQMFGYDGSSLPKSPTLIAWASRPLATPEISGKKPIHHGQTMLLMPVAIDTTGYLVINSLQTQRTMINKTGTVRSGDPNYLSFNKTVELGYRLPTDRPYTPISISLLSSSMGAPLAFKTYAYNFKRNMFSEFKLTKGWINIEPPAEYIGPDNTIRLKLEANKNQWGEVTTSSLYFEVQGTWQN